MHLVLQRLLVQKEEEEDDEADAAGGVVSEEVVSLFRSVIGFFDLFVRGSQANQLEMLPFLESVLALPLVQQDGDTAKPIKISSLVIKILCEQRQSELTAGIIDTIFSRIAEMGR